MPSAKENFELLSLPVHLLAEVVSKFSPPTLSLMREASPRVNVRATHEAIRRDLVAVGSLIIFHHDKVRLDANPDMLVASSLIYQSENEQTTYQEETERFWEDRMSSTTPTPNFPVSMAIMHLGGMIIDTVIMDSQKTADDMINVLDTNNFGINHLSVFNCDPKAVEEVMRRYEPKELSIEEDFYIKQDYSIHEMYEMAAKHLTSRTLKKIVISAEKEFPFHFVCQFIENVKNGIDGVHSIEILCDRRDFYEKFESIFAGVERIPIVSYPDISLCYSEGSKKRHLLVMEEDERNLLTIQMIRVSSVEEILETVEGLKPTDVDHLFEDSQCW